MTVPGGSAGLQVVAPDGVPVLTRGSDVAAVLVPFLANLRWPDGSVGVDAGDVVVISSKIVSKAEGRLARADEREAVIDGESVRVVATRTYEDDARPALRIVENRQGVVMAAAGVDASNTYPGTILLLPEDPDASARAIRRGLAARLGGVRPGVVLTDSAGKPWRAGITDFALGAAGVRALDDHRGEADDAGRPLESTVVAAADEIAAAADLVKGPTGGRPVAVVRGVGHLVTHDDGPGARGLNRTGPEDMFALGTREAWELGRAGRPLP
ncbi:coenzyme F420-0:L-glutamate ligase/coenzyme F420-1:gamma-L-glutamate ligase [Salana multivorans]|uniref:Coenzyme F420-0:L-glutamate ligase/coenzyme F420-1:gamma-L-glutamate ligase n=1 Tax=Salana multivorans TaxID=120377 RepID=A0A3N2D2L0_9MICO|nr:coenzyme F420-0:L-glutamate ligase [Salana multivorans]ROR94001.1 coenzyme F420-0:L-glutamate ligase/coenzyme F420-1:gamma-L-glutamate ligase [Salana multivorans]